MRRLIGGHEFWCGTPSYQRPNNVSAQTEKRGEFTWYVMEYEEAVYAAAGAKTRSVDIRGVGAARTAILEDAFALELPCLMIDDDYEDAWQLHQIGDKRPARISFEDAVVEIWERLRMSDYYLGAPSQTLNPFYVKSRTKTHATIGGYMQLIKPNPLRFRNEFFCGEDTDYAAQHMHAYGGVLRCDDIMCKFTRYQAGGCTEVREDPEWREKAFRMLRASWGTNIVKNSKGRTSIRWRTPK